MTVQGPVKKQQPDGMSHRGVIKAPVRVFTIADYPVPRMALFVGPPCRILGGHRGVCMRCREEEEAHGAGGAEGVEWGGVHKTPCSMHVSLSTANSWVSLGGPVTLAMFSQGGLRGLSLTTDERPKDAPVIAPLCYTMPHAS